MRTLSLLLSLLGVSATARAADVRHDHTRRDNDPVGWYAPDYAKLQTGGYTGLVNVGLGYAAFGDVLNVGVDYGYVPENVAGRNVHSVGGQFSIRPVDARLGDFRFVPAYFGGGALFTFGDGYFVRTPERYHHYDVNYYPPTGVHWTAHVGLELDYLPPSNNFFERHGLYWEVRTIDTFFFSYVENPRSVSPLQAMASALGYRAAW